MSTSIDQKAYLQKYLGGPSKDKKKKKKKVVKGQGFKIIDDDLDFSKLRSLEGDELDILDEGEDAPQIAGIIDERPEEIKKLEQFKTTSKWRVINQDDGFNSKLQIEEIKKDVKEQEKENELIFGKMYSDSEDEKKDSDQSPPKKNTQDRSSKNSKRPQNNSDSDFSPPRKKNHETSPKISKRSQDNDSDLSPPRKAEKRDIKDKPRKPSRWEQLDESESKFRSRSNGSEDSSPRRKKHRSNQSPKRNKMTKRSDSSDMSPPRKSQKIDRNKKNSHVSPSQRSRRDSPLGKRNRTPDSDISPPRKSKDSQKRSKNDKDKYAKDRRYDLSPEYSQKHKHRHKQTHKSPDITNNRRQDSDSDISPPRKSQYKREERKNYKRSDSPPPSNKKMAKTLEGKMAGLQDAYQLRQENEAFRRREEEAFSKMTDDVSGRNAKAVSRKGKRETSEERQKQKEKAERQKELDEKYKRWNKGIKQIEAQEAKIQEYMHEASKPLARHKDDRDLEDRLKQVEREGDPMLRYIREKKVERGEVGPEKPKYKGNFPPNRFNIRPGYRWDGVDRSNGYEKKYFEHQSKRKAQEEEAYKWSTEDL
ncbi:BUD13 homolog [Battus philenor]|uniref:BUD13 homolog n=1 Tax=Battus philenor TaxID=42288 RepID=UPI0035CF7097